MAKKIKNLMFEELLKLKGSDFIFELLNEKILDNELYALFHLIGVEQSKKWHSEGDAFIHTMLVLDEARKLTDDPAVLWAALFHDTGKRKTAGISESGNITHHGHDKISVEIWDEFSSRWEIENKEKTSFLIKNHMRIALITEMRKSKQDELINSKWFTELFYLLVADTRGSISTVEDDNKKLKSLNFCLDVLSQMKRLDKKFNFCYN